MNIDFNDIEFYPSLIRDYINGVLKENSIVNWNYDIEAIHEKASLRKFTSRKLLVERLKAQNKNTELSPASSQNLENLSKKNCFTVCTGHQLCIYGGPAYFYSKIIDVITLSKKLNGDQNEQQFVPVFWMASEDHDYEEVSEVNIFNKKLQWENSDKGPVGKMSTKNLAQIQTEFSKILGNDQHALELARIFDEAYNSGNNLTEATRHFVNSVFGKDGLLIIDGDDSELKQLLTPIIKEEITNQTTESVVNSTIAKLESYKVQANPRPVNLFYLNNNYRERLIAEGDDIHTADKRWTWSRDEFLEHASQNPERISPNVFLRPVYQELCLPNVAYVGGGGEISYWLELPELFNSFKVPFPIPVVRNSYLYLTQKQLNIVDGLNLKLKDFFSREELIVKLYLDNSSNNNHDLSAEKQTLVSFFNDLELKSEGIDKNLKKVVQGELKRSLSALENIKKRFRNAEKTKKTIEIARISKIKSILFPEGSFQERTNSIFDFTLRSDANLFSKISESNTPFKNSIKVIVY